MLSIAAERLYESENSFIKYFNNWTGHFALLLFTNDGISIYGDAAGMYTLFYGFYNGKLYVSSHTNLLGSVCDVTFDAYVERLINYRFYRLFGRVLPGDLSPYKEFKQVIPNHCVKISDGKTDVQRFFPTKDNALLDISFDDVAKNCAKILKNSMSLIHRKWNRCAISMSGGCDSKTTLSSTAGNYDKYSYFSYTSQDTEKVDAEAAEKICEALGLSHKIYTISDNDADYENIEKYRAILEFNSGSIGRENSNDVRKRVSFSLCDDFDVEVKSWVSEVGRAYYFKRFNKKKFPKKLTPQYATLLYKVFFSRSLIRETNRVFKEFLDKYYTDEVYDLIPWYDLLFWEFRVSSWNGLNITGSHQFSYDITIPYNNRVLLQNMLSVSVEDRINDAVHKSVTNINNPVISELGIHVNNVKHTTNRARLEGLYLNVFSKIPF